MENLLLLVAAVAFVGFLIAVKMHGDAVARRRSQGLKRVAAARGWDYTLRDDSFGARFSGPPFGVGRNRIACNIVTGVHDGRKFAAFDYWYTVTEIGLNGKLRSETYDWSVVAISTTKVFPRLEVTPEGMVSRLVGRLSGADIELESEHFNRAFTVHCEDRRFATDVLHPRMMEHLLTMPTLAWTLRNGTLMLVGAGQHTLRQLDGRLRIIDEILDLVPPHVWGTAGG